MLEKKYEDLLEYGKSLGMKDVTLMEEDGFLKIKGTVPYKYDKKRFWDKIKTYENYEEDLKANILIDNTDIFGIYVVQPGDTLSKISKWLLDDPMKYMDIFNANADILTDPNKISVGQKLKLPNP